MEVLPSISLARLVITALAIVLEIALPLVVALVVRRRLGVGWRYFAFGALIFFLFQIISRVPLVQAAQFMLGPQLQASRVLLVGWLLVLSVTAGLFEEIGRYVGYRWLMKREEKTWNKAVMYGVGHGGLESMLLIAGLTLLGLINLLVLPSVPLDSLPEAQRAQVQAQLAAVQAQPIWLPLVAVWERIWAMAAHVAFAVLVLQVFQRGRLAWLWLSIGAHTLLNFVSVGGPLLLGLEGSSAILWAEVSVTLFGLAALWVIWRLRTPPAEGRHAAATT